jgi:hypothetical protein
MTQNGKTLFRVTERGRQYAERAIEVCGYLGPAPVSLEAYSAMLRFQFAGTPEVKPDHVTAALSHLVLSQKAMQMASRLQAMQAGDTPDQTKKTEKDPNAPPPPLKSTPKPRSGLEGDNSSQFAMQAVLKDLDPATRSMILKMQPRVREELLQSLREEGPEGYQRFIRDYFKRLTKAGQPAK